MRILTAEETKKVKSMLKKHIKTSYIHSLFPQISARRIRQMREQMKVTI